MPYRYLILRIASALTFLCVSALSQTPIGRAIPGSYIVTYRNGAIPATAELHARSAGATMLQRHEHLDVAIVQADSANAASVRAALAADPTIQYIAEDRVVSGATIQARAADTTAAGNDGFNLANKRYVELPAQSRGALAIIASTNPACAENLAAGATCTAGPVTLPYYSNFGTPLNALAAPGGSYPGGPASDPTQPSGWIWSACSNGIPSTISGSPTNPAQSFGCFGLGQTQYVQAMGTSASAPLAAGAAALLLAANPSWNAATVAALRTSAVSIATLPAPQVNAAALIIPVAAPVTQHITIAGAR